MAPRCRTARRANGCGAAGVRRTRTCWRVEYETAGCATKMAKARFSLNMTTIAQTSYDPNPDCCKYDHYRLIRDGRARDLARCGHLGSSAGGAAGSGLAVRKRPGRACSAVAMAWRCSNRSARDFTPARRRRSGHLDGPVPVGRERAALAFPSVQLAVIARALSAMTLRPAPGEHSGCRAERADGNQGANQIRPVLRHVASSRSRPVKPRSRRGAGRQSAVAIAPGPCVLSIHPGAPSSEARFVPPGCQRHYDTQLHQGKGVRRGSSDGTSIAL